tara:strand:- start:152 stop:346 length:195 start_codon:yes stop_codon:yes gene_type:complete
MEKAEDSSKSTYIERLLNEKSSRIDLNDLLARAKQEKKNQNKVNILICTCATLAATTLVLIFSF